MLVASGVRYDLAATSPEYVRELATHHVGGYLKIAPEHTEDGPLSKMMKPGIGSYDQFKQLFDEASEKAGKKQYLIPYFIAAHPGTTDQDMLNLALWLKRNGFRADQVQTFLPSPMASATAMYHTGPQPAAQAAARRRRDGVRPEGPDGAPAAQGVPALPRSRELAAAARGAAADGARRSDRQRPEQADPAAPAGGARPASRGAPDAARQQRRTGRALPHARTAALTRRQARDGEADGPARELGDDDRGFFGVGGDQLLDAGDQLAGVGVRARRPFGQQAAQLVAKSNQLAHLGVAHSSPSSLIHPRRPATAVKFLRSSGREAPAC